MSIEQAQICRCDRCGTQLYQRYDGEQETPVPPAEWLILHWQAGPYEFCFCPGCTAAFVEFAAQAKAPRLYVVEQAQP